MTSPIKILSLSRSSLSENRGTPIRIRSLLKGISTDSRFKLVTASWNKEAVFPDVDHFFLTNNPWKDLPLLISVIRKYNIDAIIGHTMATWYYLLIFKLATKTKIILEMHGFLEEEAKLYKNISSLRYHMDKWFYKIVYKKCNLISTCSNTASDILSKYNSNVVTIFGGADISLFNPNVIPGTYAPRTPGSILVGYAGNTRIWQGVDFLGKAFSVLRKSHPEFELALLTSEKKGIPEGEGIFVIGGIPHEKVPAFLAECDILVIPRPQNEVNRISFPSKLIEYMSMGKPVIASATSDCHKIIKDGVDGVIFRPGDEQGLTDALIRLSDPTLRETIGAQAYKTVKQNYTWEHQSELLANGIVSLWPPEAL